MNIETIANQFETRAATLLRYYTGLLESSRKTAFGFKIYSDPFDMVYVVMEGNRPIHPVGGSAREVVYEIYRQWAKRYFK